jgi:hypothetical protein
MDTYIVALGIYAVSIAAIGVIGREVHVWYKGRKQPIQTKLVFPPPSPPPRAKSEENHELAAH